MSTRLPLHAGFKTSAANCGSISNVCSLEAVLRVTVVPERRACRPPKFAAAWTTRWKIGHSISRQSWRKRPCLHEPKGNDRMVRKKPTLYRSNLEGLQCCLCD